MLGDLDRVVECLLSTDAYLPTVLLLMLRHQSSLIGFKQLINWFQPWLPIVLLTWTLYAYQMNSTKVCLTLVMSRSKGHAGPLIRRPKVRIRMNRETIWPMSQVQDPSSNEDDTYKRKLLQPLILGYVLYALRNLHICTATQDCVYNITKSISLKSKSSFDGIFKNGQLL